MKGHGNSIERKGVDDTMAGFDLAVEDDAKYYMLWQGSTPKYTYDGDDIVGNGRSNLVEMLTAAAVNGSQAQYTLRFYKHLGKDHSVDASTPPYASFNFKLQDNTNVYPGAAVAGTGRDPGTSAILAELQKLNNRMDKIEQDGVGDIEEDPFEKYQRILETPAAEKLVVAGIGWLNKLFKLPGMNNRTPNQGGGISGVNIPDDEKIQQSVMRLQAIDPLFADHLQLLADLADASPKIYNRAIAKLEEMKDLL
jgi:hypothetical protein